MLSPDLALALAITRTSQYYQAHAPAYITYTEHTHVTAPSLGRSQDINRSVAVRVADNFAVMKDLPSGGDRTGQAFPIIPYFDAFSDFGFTWFANLKKVDINLVRRRVAIVATPEPDDTVNAVVPYWSSVVPRYAPDSTETAPHILSDPTPKIMSANYYYWSSVTVDPASQVASQIAVSFTGDDEQVVLDYKIVDGYWVITHGHWSGTQHAFIFTAKVIADVDYTDFTFPTEPPDPRLAGAPSPSPSPSSSP